MVIFSGRLEAEQVDQEVDKVKSLIESGNGSMHSIERMGRRRLAYEIRRETDGYYTIFHFEDQPDRIATIKRAWRLNESILRHMVFRKEKFPEGPTVDVEEEPRRAEPEAAPPAEEAAPAPAETAEAKPEEETPAPPAEEPKKEDEPAG